MVDNIKMGLRKQDVTVWTGFIWQYMVLWWALVNRVMNLRVSWKVS